VGDIKWRTQSREHKAENMKWRTGNGNCITENIKNGVGWD